MKKKSDALIISILIFIVLGVIGSYLFYMVAKNYEVVSNYKVKSYSSQVIKKKNLCIYTEKMELYTSLKKFAPSLTLISDSKNRRKIMRCDKIVVYSSNKEILENFLNSKSVFYVAIKDNVDFFNSTSLFIIGNKSKTFHYQEQKIDLSNHYKKDLITKIEKNSLKVIHTSNSEGELTFNLPNLPFINIKLTIVDVGPYTQIDLISSKKYTLSPKKNQIIERLLENNGQLKLKVRGYVVFFINYIKVNNGAYLDIPIRTPLSKYLEQNMQLSKDFTYYNFKFPKKGLLQLKINNDNIPLVLCVENICLFNLKDFVSDDITLTVLVNYLRE